MPGPVPNLEGDLARPRSRKGGEVQPVTRGTRKPVSIPEADPDWHPIARQLWAALAESGQSEFYQQSDWAFAYSLMDDLSHYKKPLISKDGDEYHKRSGQMLQTIYTAMERLMIAEGDRRRVRVELHEPEDDKPDAELVAIDSYKDRLGVKG